MKRYEVLERLIKEHGWKKGAEIGVHRGRTFFHLKKRCSDLGLIGVDNWSWDEDDHEKDIERGLSLPRKREDMEFFARDVKKRASDLKGATIYHMDSVAAAKLVEDESLDFVFIDAEHTTDCVLEDIKAWSPKVKPGGWILGHDEQWPSVRRALSQAFDKWTVHPDNVWSVP